MSGISGLGSGGYSWVANQLQQFQQNLFNKVDGNSNGSITKTELEQAVTGDGGTTQSADSLFPLLDPTNAGSVTEPQFSQALLGPPYSDQMGAQLIANQAQQSNAATPSGPQSQFAQNLFSLIDTDSSGSISKTELENAVTKLGGTATQADAIYAKLDSNGAGSVSEQQLAQALSQGHSRHHHHHHHIAGSKDLISDPITQSATDGSSDGGSADASQASLVQNLFSQIDTNADTSISQTELENAVTAAGGTTKTADAVFARLDPNNSGTVTEQAFAHALRQAAITGNSAADAIAILTRSFDQVAAAKTITVDA